MLLGFSTSRDILRCARGIAISRPETSWEPFSPEISAFVAFRCPLTVTGMVSPSDSTSTPNSVIMSLSPASLRPLRVLWPSMVTGPAASSDATGIIRRVSSPDSPTLRLVRWSRQASVAPMPVISRSVSSPACFLTTLAPRD